MLLLLLPSDDVGLFGCVAAQEARGDGLELGVVRLSGAHRRMMALGRSGEVGEQRLRAACRGGAAEEVFQLGPTREHGEVGRAVAVRPRILVPIDHAACSWVEGFEEGEMVRGVVVVGEREAEPVVMGRRRRGRVHQGVVVGVGVHARRR